MIAPMVFRLERQPDGTYLFHENGMSVLSEDRMTEADLGDTTPGRARVRYGDSTQMVTVLFEKVGSGTLAWLTQDALLSLRRKE